ncbi:MAG: hypothetical protein QM704_23285 [Anaeromyxobacteraceae bacterium]
MSGSSSTSWGGLCSVQVTRPSGEPQICPRPRGESRQCESESSSTSTICPVAKPAVLETVTDVAPFAPSAVRFTEVPPDVDGQRCGPMITIGCASGTPSMSGLEPFVFTRIVWPAPAPRSVTFFEMRTKSLTRKVPAESWTTAPGAQASRAAWIAAEASEVPLPYVAALSVAQTAVRFGMPPLRLTPGFHCVARSAART